MSVKKKSIHLSIAFGDAILPIIDCDDGVQRVPLKPIADQIGLDWKGQKRKFVNDDYKCRRFGLILGEARLPQMADLGVNRDQYLIRVDRVTSFLNTLSPQMIRSQGNDDSANWLESKHEEWDNALHDYETQGVAVKPESKSCVIDVIAKIDRIKNPELKRIAAQQANKSFGIDIPVGNQIGLAV